MMVSFSCSKAGHGEVFDPYLSSRPLANALMQSPPGQLITEGFYFQFSSVFFYTNRTGLLFSQRRANLEYGSYAPGAPQVFMVTILNSGPSGIEPDREYLLTFNSNLPRYAGLVGQSSLYPVAGSGRQQSPADKSSDFAIEVKSTEAAKKTPRKRTEAGQNLTPAAGSVR